MKVVILAGGYGTRISEESGVRPKPMVTIGGRPILWHIMKMYSHYGHNEFIICLGYKGDVIKEYFNNLSLHASDVTFDYTNGNGGQPIVHKEWAEPWKVSLIETGIDTMTGGRIKQIEKYIEDDTFLLTYGDGVTDLNINKSIEWHTQTKKALTITAIQPQPRFGTLEIDDKGTILEFKEKSKIDVAWVNGGFMVADKSIFKYLHANTDIFEKEPMNRMVNERLVSAYKHSGFWQPMDTLRERHELEEIWVTGKAPWKVWE